MMNKCAFCDITKERNESITCITPLKPVTKGHKIFFSSMHTEDAADDPTITAQLFKSASEYAKRKNESFNLITSKGKAATQSIYHLHVHYVPRTNNDGLMLPWSGQ